MSFNCYITFPTTFFAIRAEAVLKDQLYTFKMVPVPRSISSSCGTALRCSCDELSSVKGLLSANEVELEGYYKLEEVGLKVPSVEELFFDE